MARNISLVDEVIMNTTCFIRMLLTHKGVLLKLEQVEKKTAHQDKDIMLIFE